MDLSNNIIYALFCPISNVPVYVGQSSAGIKRPITHIKEKSHNEKVNEWVYMLRNNYNKEPLVIVLESFFPCEFLKDKEEFWINKFISKGYLLLNIKSVTPVIVSNILSNEKSTDNYMYRISNFVRLKRKQNKLTQEDLALNAGVGLRFVRDLEQLNKNNFQTESIQKILDLFGASLDVSLKIK